MKKEEERLKDDVRLEKAMKLLNIIDAAEKENMSVMFIVYDPKKQGKKSYRVKI